jgi:hypothetical protein
MAHGAERAGVSVGVEDRHRAEIHHDLLTARVARGASIEDVDHIAAIARREHQPVVQEVRLVANQERFERGVAADTLVNPAG